MKKIKILSLLITTICIITAFCGCHKDIPNPPVEGLTSEQVETIRNVMAAEHKGEKEYDVNNLSITKCLGTYNGNIVFDWYDGNGYYMAMVYDVVIDGVYIMTYSHIQTPKVYISPDTENDGGSVMPLDKAYEKGYITKDNLYSIAEAIKK